IDLAVLVLVYLDPDDALAVHIAPGVEPSVAIRVVFENLKFPGLPVVNGLDALIGAAAADGKAWQHQKKNGANAHDSRAPVSGPQRGRSMRPADCEAGLFQFAGGNGRDCTTG